VSLIFRKKTFAQVDQLRGRQQRLSYAKSEMIDPDETSEDRTAAREEYMRDLKAMYPGKPFRAPRGKRTR
jgi:hypothetical protein